MPRKKKSPDPPPRRSWGAWSVDFIKARGRWRARPPASVDPKRAPRYFADEEGAKAWAAAEQARLAVPVAVTAPIVTLEDWLGHWFLVTAASSDWSATTQTTYANMLWHWSPLYDRPLAALRTIELQAIVGQLYTQGPVRRPPVPGAVAVKPPRPLSPAFIANSVNLLQRALEDAVRDGLISRNPASFLKPPAVRRSSRRLWSPEEMDRLVAELERTPFPCVYALLFGCGLRIGEALALTWDVIDLEQRRLTVRRTRLRNSVQEWTKSRRHRVVSFPPQVWAALIRHRDHSPLSGPVWVFTREDGQPIGYKRVWRALIDACTRAGVDYHSSHAGRHTHATELLADGVPVAAVAERLGHANAAITLRTYAHPTADAADLALEASGRLMERFAVHSGENGAQNGAQTRRSDALPDRREDGVTD